MPTRRGSAKGDRGQPARRLLVGLILDVLAVITGDDHALSPGRTRCSGSSTLVRRQFLV